MPRLARRTLGLQASAEWLADRDFELARDIAGGLGTRPSRWWQFESDRPHLSAGAGLDVYAHLREGLAPDAEERLRYLVISGELMPDEARAIFAGRGPRYAWRKRVLAREGVLP